MNKIITNILFIILFIISTILYMDISNLSLIFLTFLISYTIFFWYVYIRKTKKEIITKEMDEILHP